MPAAYLNHEGPRVLQHAIFRLQRPALIEMVIHALCIEEVLNPVARQDEADVAHDFAGGIVDADGVDLGEDHADDVAAAVQQRAAAVALANVSSHDDGGAAGGGAFAAQTTHSRGHRADRPTPPPGK